LLTSDTQSGTLNAGFFGSHGLLLSLHLQPDTVQACRWF